MPARTIVKPTVVSAEVGGDIVLLDVQAGTYFGLDDVGTAIWRQLDQGVSDEEIVRRLLDEYDVDPVRLQAEVAAFLGLLRDKGLAELVEG